MVRVLLYDNNLLLSAAFQSLLKNQEGITVVNTATTQNLLKTLKNSDVDLLLISLVLPGNGNIEFIKQIRSSYPELPLLVIGNVEEKDYMLRILKTGVSGFIALDDSPKKLIEAVKALHQGKQYFNREISAYLLERLSSDEPRVNGHEALSDREFEILQQLASGNTIPDIAKSLNISHKTVSTYKTRIMRKMDFESITDLVKYALKENLTQ